MSDKAQNESSSKKKFLRKAGKTLLIKAKDGCTVNEDWFKSIDGLQKDGIVQTEKTGSYFLTFDDVGKSLDALKHIRKEHDKDVMVKFAHYRVFFTMEGLSESTDYNTVKQAHTKFIQDNTNSEVLYYKLYRNKTYLGCGDVTIDTKDALDKLLNKDQNKEFDLGDGMTGKFYRYNGNKAKPEGGHGHEHEHHGHEHHGHEHHEHEHHEQSNVESA